MCPASPPSPQQSVSTASYRTRRENCLSLLGPIVEILVRGYVGWLGRGHYGKGIGGNELVKKGMENSSNIMTKIDSDMLNTHTYVQLYLV